MRFVDPVVELRELHFLVNSDIRPYKVTALSTIADDNHENLMKTF